MGLAFIVLKALSYCIVCTDEKINSETIRKKISLAEKKICLFEFSERRGQTLDTMKTLSYSKGGGKSNIIW